MDETHYWSKIIYFSNKQNNKLLKLRRFLLSKSKLLKHDRFFVWLGPSQGESLIVVFKFYLNIKCQFNIKLTISGNPEDVVWRILGFSLRCENFRHSTYPKKQMSCLKRALLKKTSQSLVFVFVWLWVFFLFSWLLVCYFV